MKSKEKPSAEVIFVRFSDAELKIFEKLILVKMELVKAEIASLEGACVNQNGTDDTGKPFIRDEAGSDEESKSKNITLLNRQKKLLVDLKNALNRVHNKQYGICRITGTRIKRERLLSNLFATTTAEAKKEEDAKKSSGELKTHRRR